MDIKHVQPIFVIVKVVWQRRDGDSSYHDLLLLDSPGTDNSAWHEMPGMLSEGVMS